MSSTPAPGPTAEEHRPHPADLPPRAKALILAGVLLGLLLAALDQTIVATAGPAIQLDLKIPNSLYAWITTAYLVASTVLVPIYGKLSDLYGRKPILVAAISIFLAGSLLCGFAQTTAFLIAARAVQGIGSAGLFTTAFAVIGDLFPPSERGKYNGLFGAVFGLSSVVGPLVGGFITDHFGWHWVFFVNLPIGAVALSFIFAKMPRLAHPEMRSQTHIDVPGAIALAVFVVPLLVALSLGKSAAAVGRPGYEWGSPQILAMLALSLVGLVAFVRVELRSVGPILDLHLFRNRVFAVGNLAAFVIGTGFLATIVFLPLFMVRVVGLSATHSGLTTVPLTFGLVAGNVVSGQLSSRLGRYRILMLISLAILGASYAVMGFTLTAQSTQLEVSVKMFFVGIGLGPSIPLYVLAIQNGVEPRQIGVATSAATFFRQMGATVGVAILGTVFANTMAAEMPPRMAAATASVPPAMKAWMRQGAPGSGGGSPGSPGSGEEGGGGGGMLEFDAVAVKARIGERFGSVRGQIEAALRDGDAGAAKALLAEPFLNEQLRAALQNGVFAAPPETRVMMLARATAGLEAAQEQAESTVDAVDLARKESFTIAIREIYRWAVLVALLGFLVTLALPDLPLRRSNRPDAGAAQAAA